MKPIDFETADMILRGFSRMGCRISTTNQFNKYGMKTSNIKEVKTVHVEIFHQEMGLISIFIISKNTYIKLLKNEQL